MSIHIPVMVRETVAALNVQHGGRYIDCTLGAGGHAAAILERSMPGGQLMGIDADPDAIDRAWKRLKAHSDSILLLNDNFVNLGKICREYDFYPVHGILFDLGLSSMQLGGGRGFSFQSNTPLDMRFDPRQRITAADIVNGYSYDELAHIIRTYGEDTNYRRIARSIVAERPVYTTLELAQVIAGAVGGRRGGRIHPATKTFQALRIAVNQELEHLESALTQAIEVLGVGGRLVVLSYNSLEDRIVKQILQRESRDCICPPGTPACICGHTASLRLVNKKIITPSDEEVNLNPRSRSAKLRAAERVGVQYGAFTAGTAEPCFQSGSHSWGEPQLISSLP